MAAYPNDPEFDPPDRFKARTVEEELLAAAREEAKAQGEPVPPMGGAYDAGRVGPRRQ